MAEYLKLNAIPEIKKDVYKNTNLLCFMYKEKNSRLIEQKKIRGGSGEAETPPIKKAGVAIRNNIE